MVALIGSRNAKRLGIAPAFALAQNDGCVRIHIPRPAATPARPKFPVSFEISLRHVCGV
jgi:hypothetical protein